MMKDKSLLIKKDTLAEAKKVQKFFKSNYITGIPGAEFAPPVIKKADNGGYAVILASINPYI